MLYQPQPSDSNKNAYILQGILTVKETGVGIPNLLVRAFDFDYPSKRETGTTEERIDRTIPYDSLGSVLTNQQGEFFILFEESDFQVTDKEDLRPEIYLVIERPYDVLQEYAEPELEDGKDKILYTTKPIRAKSGKIETYHIRIEKAILDRWQIPYNETNIPVSEIDKEALLRNQTTAFNNLEKIAEVRKDIITKQKDLQKRFEEEASQKFKGLSKLPETFRQKDTFFVKGQNLREKQNSILNRNLSELNHNIITGPIPTFKLSFTQTQLEEMGLWNTFNGTPQMGTIPYNSAKSSHNNTDVIETEKLKCIKRFTEADLNDPIPNPNTPNEIETPSLPQRSINERIQDLLETSTSPETALKYDKIVDPEYKNNKEGSLSNTVNKLTLTGGPADVTSYHDFHSLQIAFEHIWTEVFDKKLEKSALELYTETVKQDEGYSETSYQNQMAVVVSKLDSSRRIMDYGFWLQLKQSLIEEAKGLPGKGGNVDIPLYLESIIPSTTISTVNDLQTVLNFYKDDMKSYPHLEKLVDEIDKRLSEPHKFDAFAPNSVNYGVMFTFRQQWEPKDYQVGKLVSSIPLAPKEVRKYSTKRVSLKSRNQKSLEDRESKGHSESSSTSRAESEIINRATNKTGFEMTAKASLSIGVFGGEASSRLGIESEKFSQDTKKGFSEAVRKASEEYRQQNKIEVDTASKDEFESTSSGEIMNPNDEITVTYLFYELQRQYDISEKLHRMRPVVLVANEVPQPDEIDYDWLMANAWILKKVILDDMYLVPLEYLSSSLLGEELALNVIKETFTRQAGIVQSLVEHIKGMKTNADQLFGQITDIIKGTIKVDGTQKDFMTVAAALFNPAALIFGGGGGGPDYEKIKEATNMTLERTEKEKQQLESKLTKEVEQLNSITQEYAQAMRRRFEMEHQISLLRLHVKENILYYMQAIWDYEPTDQRFFRLYDIEIDWFEPGTEEVGVSPVSSTPIIINGKPHWRMSTPVSEVRISNQKRKLVEVADLDNLLGYKGNYMIFPVKETNYLHEYMMKDFIDDQTKGIKDPDEFAAFSTDDLIAYLKCIRKNAPEIYEVEKDRIIEMINVRQQSPRKDKERIIVPTDSLYIEALPGKHPLMEDFKLAHRALDVKKVQAEVRHAELENLRLAARLLEGEREDPDVEKKIVIEGGQPVNTNE